jgi:TctA family transporter
MLLVAKGCLLHKSLYFVHKDVTLLFSPPVNLVPLLLLLLLLLLPLLKRRIRLKRSILAQIVD